MYVHIHVIYIFHNNFDVDIKAIPVETWTIPEDSSRLRLPDFKTIGT
jgi:hypothetical protein